MPSDMIVLTRVFDLLEWLLPKGERFPRAYRHSVSKRLMDAALDLQDGLFLAQTRTGAARLAVLNDCDAALSRLRLYLRLVHHWHWLNDGQYEHVTRMEAEIGRLLGAWIMRCRRDLHAQGGTSGPAGAGPGGTDFRFSPGG